MIWLDDNVKFLGRQIGRQKLTVVDVGPFRLFSNSQQGIF